MRTIDVGIMAGGLIGQGEHLPNLLNLPGLFRFRRAAARAQAGRVFPVGYMKRYDPSWRLLREMIDGQGERLLMVSVEVNDPDSWPFVAHRDFVAGDAVPKDLIEQGRA